MKIYHIKDEYVTFLRQYDKRVELNKRGHRPYIGTVLVVEGIKYYAPLTSPKEKHKNMKNGKDFRKINGGVYGAINFNCMIPVIDDAVVLVDIDNESDRKYKRLLQNQYNAIIKDRQAIYKTAANLHTLILTDTEKLTSSDQRIQARCCNLKLLESVYLNYRKK